MRFCLMAKVAHKCISTEWGRNVTLDDRYQTRLLCSTIILQNSGQEDIDMLRKLICSVLFPIFLFMGCNTENEKALKSTFAVLCDDWIYYTAPNVYSALELYDLSRLYKIRKNGTGLMALNHENTANLTAYKDWIYFISGEQIQEGDDISSNHIYRVRKDGTGREKIIDVNNAGYSWPLPYCDQFWIVNNQIIFQDWVKDGDEAHPRICRADMNGKNRKVICEDRVTQITDVVDGWIYFYRAVENTGDEYAEDEKYKIRLNGTRKTKVSGYEEYNFITEQGKAYYISSEKLLCTDIKTDQTTELAENVISFGVSDHVLFYAVREEGIFKTELNHLEKVRIFAHPAMNMDIVGEWIFAQIILDDEQGQYKYVKLKTDGSEFSEIDNVFDERAYKNPKYYDLLYQDFQCVQSSGGFRYPKTWKLSAEFYDTVHYREGSLPDERMFSDYGNNLSGQFSFKYKNSKDNHAPETYFWLTFDHEYTDKKIAFVTLEGKNGIYEFTKTDQGYPALYARISDEQIDFNFNISFKDQEHMDKYHDILIDMMKCIRLKSDKGEVLP